jgi:hypothetical protein
MKVISLWQPWASLLIQGHKFIETRSWAAPKTIVGIRIGIAATKQVKPEQRAAFDDPEFQKHYALTELPALDDLPRGCILGTALLHSCDVMTEEDLEDVTEEEKSFGHWEVGRYAWRMRHPEPYAEPIAARGLQGVWEFTHDASRIIPFARRPLAQGAEA